MTTYVRTQDFVRAAEIEKYEPAAQISLTVSGGETPTDTSSEMNVRGARAIVVQADHYRGVAGADSASTDLDIIVYSKSGSSFDRTAYASMNVGAATIASLNVTPGMESIRVYIVNNDAANATKVLPTVKVTY